MDPVPSLSFLIDRVQKVNSGSDEGAAEFLHLLNAFLYQKSGLAPDHFSPFHAWWEANHERVLSLGINKEACNKVAGVLLDLKRQRPEMKWRPMPDVTGVGKMTIANVRFFTAVQDFKINIYKDNKNPYRDSIEDRTLFDPKLLSSDNEAVSRTLAYLGVSGSQGDKRQAWMRGQAKFLIDVLDGQAFGLLEQSGRDALKLRSILTADSGLGFKEKKADMFIRDMVEFDVWQFESNLDMINVASDVNTMRVALRTGIIDGRVPLISSFLDIYCYQYGLMDRLTQLAWRTVWKEWGDIEKQTQPPAPASLDYLIYHEIGKTYCRKTARCKYRGGCPFDSHCETERRKLQPPKSISIYGQTGWISAASDEGGGLGLMS